MTNRRPAPITDWDWQDYTCGFTCPHCGEREQTISEPGEPATCWTCGMRYWLEVRVTEESPAMDAVTVDDVLGIAPEMAANEWEERQ